MSSQPVAVDPDDAIAEDAVEFDADAPAEIRFGDVERAPIPADAVLGMVRPDRAEAVLTEFLVAFGIQRELIAQSWGTSTMRQLLSSNVGLAAPRSSPALTSERDRTKSKSRASSAACPRAKRQF